MRIGLGIWTMQATPGTAGGHAALYREFLEASARADSLGFDSAWTSEHHFVEDGYCPSLLVALAGAAAVTTRIGLGTGALVLPLHEPAVLRAQILELQRISGGRLELGAAVGYRPEEFTGLGVEWRTRERRFLELLGSLQAVLGRPAWAVAASPAGGRRAARHGSQVLVSPAVDDGQAATIARAYREAAGTGSVALMRDTWCLDRSSSIPTVEIADHLHRLYCVQYASWGLLRDEEGIVRPGDTARLARVLESVTRTALIGTADEIGARYRVLSRAGIDVLILRVQWGWFPGTHVLEQIERLSVLVARERA
jgi:alkanesulfonate monooxygenase SsuD/methylene tetrahydromethanopterin reductase-like flavin-dependent oxidoreductase (luciferase family)